MADSSHTGSVPANKSRFWWAVLWCENMLPNWKEELESLLQGLPYAYTVHDKDFDLSDPQQPRKAHVHFMFAYGNTTTYKHALSIFKRFNAPGVDCVNTCEAVFKVRYAYEYLIHNTKQCEQIRIKDAAAGRLPTKFLYPRSERFEGNGFDIGLFEQLTLADRHNYIKKMDKLLIDSHIYDYSVAAEIFGSDDDPVVFDIFLGHSSHFERMCKGIYLRECRAGSPPPISVQLVTKKKQKGNYVAE